MIGYVLIWLETLAAALLFEATVAAVAGRWRSLLLWRGVPLTVAVLLFALSAAVAAAAWDVHAEGVQKGHGLAFLAPGNTDAWRATTEAAVPLSMVVYTVTWTLGLGIGTVLLYRRGLRRQGEPAVPAAGSWPRGRVAAGWAVALALSAITFSNMDQAVKMQLASVRSEAGAVALSHAPPRLPDRENAALVYRRAFEALPPIRDTNLYVKTIVWLNFDRAKIDPKDKDLRDYLRDRQPGLALVRKAAALPGCSFDYNYLDWANLSLPELQQLREAARELALDAFVKASDGDAPGALEDVAALYGIAGHVNDPFLLPLVTAAAVEKSAARALEDVLTLTKPKPEELAKLPLEPVPSYQMRLHRALEMEEAFGLTAFGGLGNVDTGWLKSFRFYQGPDWLLNDVLLPLYRVFLLSDDLAGYRAMMKFYQDITKVPYYEAPPQWQKRETEVLFSRSGFLTRVLIPAIGRSRQAAAEGDAARQLALVAVALVNYRAKHDKFPDTLDALVPDYLPQVPRDPFDGKPLRFKAEGKGVVVYSVGPDLKDDGGKPWDADKREGDLTLRLKP